MAKRPILACSPPPRHGGSPLGASSKWIVLVKTVSATKKFYGTCVRPKPKSDISDGPPSDLFAFD